MRTIWYDWRSLQGLYGIAHHPFHCLFTATVTSTHLQVPWTCMILAWIRTSTHRIAAFNSVSAVNTNEHGDGLGSQQVASPTWLSRSWIYRHERFFLLAENSKTSRVGCLFGVYSTVNISVQFLGQSEHAQRWLHWLEDIWLWVEWFA